jgi:hypothetical protein
VAEQGELGEHGNRRFSDEELQAGWERDGVAWNEDEEHGNGYLYVDRQLLAATEGLDEHDLRGRLADVGFEVIDEPVPGVSRLAIPEDDERESDVPALLDDLRRREDEHDTRPLPRVTANHVVFGLVHRLWGPAAWPERTKDRHGPLPTTGPLPGESVKIAVLDTGVNDHPWFAGRVQCDPNAADDLDPDGNGALAMQAGHGTFIAGIVERYAPGADVDCRRVLSSNGHVDDLDLAKKVWECRHADIISLSLGGPTHDDVGLPALEAVLARCRAVNPNLVVVASAGNASTDRPFFPAASKGVIGVAALDDRGNRAPFSNYGWWVDACAPGHRALSTYPVAAASSAAAGLTTPDGHSLADFNGWARWSGTSFAAPVVAAAIAASMSAGVSAREAAQRLLTAAASTWRPGLGVTINPIAYA